MTEHCRRFMAHQLLAVAAVFPFCAIWFGSREQGEAFGFGLLLYTANALLLAYLVDRLFRGTDGGSTSRRPAQGALIGLALVKLAFVGGGVSLGLMVLSLPALPFVGGALVGLVSTTVVSLVAGKKTLFSIGDLRY